MGDEEAGGADVPGPSAGEHEESCLAPARPPRPEGRLPGASPTTREPPRRQRRRPAPAPSSPVLQVKCRDQDFHSGTFGGILSEPMADLVALLGNNLFFRLASQTESVPRRS